MTSALGKYSNNPAEHVQERIKARTDTTHEVGDYLLRMHPTWKLYVPERKDGKPVPAALAGNWTSPSDFALKVDAFNSIKVKQRDNSDAA